MSYSLEDQSHDSANYFDRIAKFLMSNEGEGLEESTLFENEDVLSQDVTHRSDGFLDRAPSPRNA